ncbi:FtsX-like permease family protein [Rhizomonospora bruguierae]|uniref:FtsX-like permease family protein n=1 Tax=Rhizomonospora bruguierae TaxID=1581705 RepID=UPI001BCF4843|nr:FtsX-like permease family protein [Micromonospora sp. NBRC 107566]
MIALPVLALTYAAVSYDMFTLTPEEEFVQRHGAADASLTWQYAGPTTQTWDGWSSMSDAPLHEPVTEREILAELPVGSRVIPVAESHVPLATGTGAGDLDAVGVDITDPLVAGMVKLLDGAAPRQPGEIAVTVAARKRLGVRIGDTVRGVAGTAGGAWRVTGVVEFPADLGQRVVFAPGHVPVPAGSGREPRATWLADTPHPVTWADVERYNERGIVVASRAVSKNPPSPEETAYPFDDPGRSVNGETLSMGGLIAGLGLLEVVLLAGPAFAVGARRRQRDLALVAANGGTPAHLRRIVLADGVVLGAVGAVVGIALGIVLAFTTRPLAEQYLLQSRAAGYRVWPVALLVIAVLAVVTGLLAALVPAVTAARFDLVAALTGRRGAVRSRKRWLLLGLALTAVGAAIGAYGARGTDRRAILAGLTVVELGLVLCTPALVGLIARLGARLHLAPRIALRDAARNRAAAAPAISAVMAAVAGSVALGVYLTSSTARQEASYTPGLPTGYVKISYYTDQSRDEIASRVEQAARSMPWVRDTYQVRDYGCPAGTDPEVYCSLWLAVPDENRCFVDQLTQPLTVEQRRAALADWRCNASSGKFVFSNNSFPAVDDGTLVAAVLDASPADVAGARRALAAGGVVVADPRYVKDGHTTVVVQDGQHPDVSEEKLPHLTVPAYLMTSGIRFPTWFVSPALAERTGLAALPSALVAATASVPTQAQEDALRAAVQRIEPTIGNNIGVERGADPQEDPFLYVLAAAAALITLGAAGIATGLAAADGRADLSTLAAVGASPRLRRLLSLSQSGVIAGLGAVLGVAAGLGVAFAILTAFNRAAVDSWPVMIAFPLTVPWRNLLVVLVVPLVAMLGAGLLTRSRLPIERRLE